MLIRTRARSLSRVGLGALEQLGVATRTGRQRATPRGSVHQKWVKRTFLWYSTVITHPPFSECDADAPQQRSFPAATGRWSLDGHLHAHVVCNHINHGRAARSHRHRLTDAEERRVPMVLEGTTRDSAHPRVTRGAMRTPPDEDSVALAGRDRHRLDARLASLRQLI